MAVVTGNNGDPIYGTPVKASAKNGVASAGTAEALGASQKCNGVFIKAYATNTGNIYLGDSTVDNTGFALAPADGILFYPAKDVADIYIDADTTNEGVYYWPA